MDTKKIAQFKRNQNKAQELTMAALSLMVECQFAPLHEVVKVEVPEMNRNMGLGYLIIHDEDERELKVQRCREVALHYAEEYEKFEWFLKVEILGYRFAH